MFHCFGPYYYEPTNYLFVLLSIIFIAIFFYSLFYWPAPEDVDRSKLNDEQLIKFDRDVLGMEVPIYIDQKNDYKPMGRMGLKVSFFVLVALLASMLIFKSSEKVESFSYVSNGRDFWGTEIHFIETGKSLNYTQKYIHDRYTYYFDNSFTQDNFQKPKYSENNLPELLKSINEPYYQRKKENKMNWTLK